MNDETQQHLRISDCIAPQIACRLLKIITYDFIIQLHEAFDFCFHCKKDSKVIESGLILLDIPQSICHFLIQIFTNRSFNFS